MGCSGSKTVETTSNKANTPKTQEQNDSGDNAGKVEDRDWFTITEAEAYVAKELVVPEELAQKIVESVEGDYGTDDKVSQTQLETLCKYMKSAREEMEPMFQEKDPDNKMHVTVDECVEVLQKKYPSFSEDQIKGLAKGFDKENNDQVRYGEFILFYGHLKANKDKMLSKFDELQADENGMLTYNDLKPILEKKGKPRYCTRTIFDASAGKAKEINKDEFREMMSKLAGD